MSHTAAILSRRPHLTANVSTWLRVTTLSVCALLASGVVAGQEDAESHERSSAVYGRVVDPEGRPVVGAVVSLEARGDARTGATSKDRTLGTTGPRGEFELAYTRPGPYQVSASTPELAAVLGPLMRLEGRGQRTDVGDVRLEPGVALDGRVTDPEGVGLPGVDVSVRPKEDLAELLGVGGLRYERQAETSADGWFKLRGLRSGDSIVVRLSKAGWASSDAALSWPFDEPLVLVMHQELELAGRVLDSDGKPVAGASRPLTRSAERLELRGTVVDAQGEPVAGARVSCTRCSDAWTDADGRFVLESLPAGEVSLAVGHRAFGQLVHRLHASPTMPPVELQYRGVAVSGRIVDAKSGRGIADALVQLLPTDEREETVWHRERSLDDGTWRFLNVEPGRYSLRVLHSSIAPFRSAPVDVGSADVDIGSTRLAAGSSITVRVEFPESVDRSRLRVGLVSPTGGPRLGLMEADGTVRFENLVAGEWTVHVDAGQGSFVEGPVIVLDSLTDHVEVEVEVD